MMDQNKNRVPLQISNGVVVVPIRYELTHALLNLLKGDLLDYIGEHKEAFAVVFDLHGIKILDAEDFGDLMQIVRMVKVMGLKVMLCGLSSGIVSTIVDMDIDVSGLDTEIDLNKALSKLHAS